MNASAIGDAMPSADVRRRTARAGMLIGAGGALFVGLATVLSPVIAATIIGGTILACLALQDLSLLISATLLFNMAGEPYRFAYQSISLGGLDLYPNDLLLLLLAGALLLKALRSGRVPSMPRDSISIVLLCYLAYGLFTLARSLPIHGSASFSAFRVQYFYGLLFFLSLPVLADRRSRRRLLVAVLIGAAWISLLGIYNVATGSFVGGRTSSHTYRYLSSLQALAVFCALSLLAGTIWSRRRSLGVVLLGTLYVAGVLISQARSVWLGALLGMLTAVFITRHWRRSLARLVLPAAAVLLLFVLLGSISGQGDLVQGIATRATSLAAAPEDLTTVWRLFVWNEALQQLKASPLLGLGLGQPFVYFDIVQNYWEDSRQLHNTYLELAYTSGAIAAMLFIVFQGMVFWRLVTTARRRAAAAGTPLLLALASCQVCLAAAAFANVVGASMVSTIYVWILSAVIVVEAREAAAEGHADAVQCHPDAVKCHAAGAAESRAAAAEGRGSLAKDPGSVTKSGETV